MVENGDKPQGPVQRYRFRVVTGDGRQLVSEVANLRLPPQPLPPKAYDLKKILVAVEGSSQGAFHAEGGVAKPFQFAAQELEFAISSPRDEASGLPTGKRVHHPVQVTRELGAASPQIWNALATNETLTSVRFGCYGVPRVGGGHEAEFFSMTLTNAQLASVDLVLPNTRLTVSTRLPIVQRASFTYQKIEWTWLDGGVSAQDDWGA